MRNLIPIVVATALALLALPAAAGTTPAVKIGDNFFKPGKVTIQKGQKVVWRWKGSNPHNVALKKPGSGNVSKRSAVKASGKFRYRFRKTGKWKVLCEIHPSSMRMKVVVKPRS